MTETMEEILYELYLNYACRALLGGGKGQYVMAQLRNENPALYHQIMTKAREKLNEHKTNAG